MGRVLWVSPSSNISLLSRDMGRHTMAWVGGIEGVMVVVVRMMGMVLMVMPGMDVEVV